MSEMSRQVLEERVVDHEGDLIKAINAVYAAMLAKAARERWARIYWATAHFSVVSNHPGPGQRVRLEVSVRRNYRT